MNISYILVVALIAVWYVSLTEAISCYQCSDSGDDASSDCVRGTLGLSIERADHERRNMSIKKLPHLKDCSQYTDVLTGRPKYQFCKIEKIYSLGNLNAFIRDCSNGFDFSKDLNMSRLTFNKYVHPDNQTSCGYSHRHAANLCVTVCAGDFCNGPLAGQSTLTCSKALTALLIVLLLFRVNYLY